MPMPAMTRFGVFGYRLPDTVSRLARDMAQNGYLFHEVDPLDYFKDVFIRDGVSKVVAEEAARQEEDAGRAARRLAGCHRLQQEQMSRHPRCLIR